MSWWLDHSHGAFLCVLGGGGCLCLRNTKIILWGYADRWLGHVYICGWTLPPLSVSQRCDCCCALPHCNVCSADMFVVPKLSLMLLLHQKCIIEAHFFPKMDLNFHHGSVCLVNCEPPTCIIHSFIYSLFIPLNCWVLMKLLVDGFNPDLCRDVFIFHVSWTNRREISPQRWWWPRLLLWYFSPAASWSFPSRKLH